MIKDYQEFSDNYLENNIIEYIDNSINESNIKDIFNNTLNKIKDKSLKVQKNVLSYLLASMISLYGIKQTSDYLLKVNLSPVQKEIAEEVIEKEKEDINLFNKVDTLTISKKGIEDIKEEESLELKPYKIGDGKITVGWGHAEDIRKSKYKIDQKITKAEAEKLFKDDIKKAEDGIKRIFKQWREKDINVELTQDMYDALISLAFNAGVGGVRMSDFIQELKKGNYERTANEIRKFGSQLFDKYPGLKKRRNKEADKFMTYQPSDELI